METLTTDYSTMTIGKIVAKDYRKAMVFKSHGIDFCCGGQISIKDAVEGNESKLDQIIGELNAIDSYENTVEDYENWPTKKLVDHIIDKHHGYVRSTILQLTPMLNKVEMVHGEWRPELVEINSLFRELSQELLLHMKKEENILFPTILQMDDESESEDHCFWSIEQPIAAMEHDHDLAGNLTKKINELTDGYAPPKGACATYIVVYKVLQEFEEDLFTHIHLENNILFPRAKQMEKNN